jgi:hypothetical protein
MFMWWRSLTISQRFLARSLFVFAFAPYLYFQSDRNLWFTAVFSVLFLNAVATFSGYETDFATWHPASRRGRLLRGWLYSGYWLRDGEGRRWVRVAFGLLGLAVVSFVAFGIAWAAVG